MNVVNNSPNKIFLIGFMGSGKSTLGNELSKRLDYDFIDLDAEIEKRLDQNISNVFKKYGEEHFRQIEASILDKITKYPKKVIVSTGGGTPCFNENLEKMNSNGVTVFLNTPVDTLAERLSKQKDHRPLLEGKDDYEELRQYIKQLMHQRMNYYNKAQYSLTNSSQLTVNRKLDALEKMIRNHPSI